MPCRITSDWCSAVARIFRCRWLGLRVHGGLLELRSDDLRFTASANRRVLATARPVAGAERAADPARPDRRLAGRTQLAALALQRSADRSQFLDAFARTDRAVGDFLLSEVLDHLEPDLVEFLIDTSVLESFDAELCAKVSAHDDAAILLERLIATDLFVVPLDDEGRWNRYHHLFGAFLTRPPRIARRNEAACGARSSQPRARGPRGCDRGIATHDGCR